MLKGVPTFEVETARRKPLSHAVSKAEQIEAKIEKLFSAELQEIRDLLDDFSEGHLHFTNEFETQIRRSEAEKAAGLRPRVRQPGPRE